MYKPIHRDTKAFSPLPPLFWGGDCHTEPVSEQQEPMHKERARAKGPLQPPRVWSGDGGGTKGPLLCECRRPCCLPSSAPPSNTSSTASSLLVMLAAILQPHQGVPRCQRKGRLPQSKGKSQEFLRAARAAV